MKQFLKRFAYVAAFSLVGPFALAELLVRRLYHRDIWFDAQAETLSLVPGKVGIYLRKVYYHLTLRNCSLECCLCFGVIISKTSTDISKGVYVGHRCSVGLVNIGEDTMLADHVQVLSGKNQHYTLDPARPFQSQGGSFTRIHIGKNSWIGSNAVIMADVGDNCVIGAGSVVTKPIPSNSVAAGNPARVFRKTYSA